MIGALMGDMIGAPYEFDRGNKTKEFPLFCGRSQFTDDSVMTVAVAEALMDSLGGDDEMIRSALVASMMKWGHRYPDAGYGMMFYRWLESERPEPYGSFGNGSAMRVSSAGWLFDSLEETRHMARLTAEVSHNHPEGIKGAEAIASAIWMARNGKGKKEIRDYIVSEFGYDLSRTCDEIRPGYYHVETCQETVPEAVTAFLEGKDFEDVIRTAVSLGGDCDTLTCIAGSIAEAFYPVPEGMEEECRKRLPEDMLAVLDRFQKQRVIQALENGSLLRASVKACQRERTNANFFRLSKVLRDSWVWVPCTAVLGAEDEEAWSRIISEAAEKGDLESLEGQELMSRDAIRLVPDVLQNGEGFFFPVFTSEEEMGEYGEGVSPVQDPFVHAMELAKNNEKPVKGIVINAFTEAFVVPREMFDVIAKLDSAVEDGEEEQ